ncbi:DUF4149 domain-containing protein [Chitinimonas taiwanensis]|jgi:hypothetical protein|uniref:TMEM205-like domain-containing protein n=1 Tax=Chitinimonas taiwanensis DSM 18899 TaxID=1121279 RepID=A0A1K2HNR5_9NEIS|nr:DUF4149 domain-containing protein [Chitinimonas taiwanensis]SFZ78209.1 protein of unknown function [Chitinimonas taiwanensis DSM 18899]
MQTFPNALRSILVVFWIGGLWIIGLLVGPLLFQQLDNGLAFKMVAVMFRAMAWVGIVAGIYIFLHILWVEGLRAFQTLELWLILAMLALTLVNHFAVFPVISEVKPTMHTAAEGVFGGGFQSWQTISSLIYLVQSVFGLIYVIRGSVK